MPMQTVQNNTVEIKTASSVSSITTIAPVALVAGALFVLSRVLKTPRKVVKAKLATPKKSSLEQRLLNHFSSNACKSQSSKPLAGKRVFIAGVGDNSGYGWAIAKACAEMGATIVFGTWPPILGIFKASLNGGKYDTSLILSDGSKMEIEAIIPLDANYCTESGIPDELRKDKKYKKATEGFSIAYCAEQLAKLGPVDHFVHSLANGPEVEKPLLETTRQGYLAALSASSYSFVRLLGAIAPNMPEGGSALALTYIAGERTIPGYGGGMSSAKASLESDVRTLAYEAGRKYGIRVNCISAGPLKSRAASAIGKDSSRTFIDRAIEYNENNAPLSRPLTSTDVGTVASAMLSPYFSAVTGETLHVDNGLHAMGVSLDSNSWKA